MPEPRTTDPTPEHRGTRPDETRPDQTRPDQDGADPSTDVMAALRGRIVELVLATPGVLELNPTLLASLRRLREPATDSAVDLVRRDGTVDVEVALTTTADHEARATGNLLRQEILSALVAVGLSVGTIRIHVVAIEAVGSAASSVPAGSTGSPVPAGSGAEQPDSAGLGER